MQLTGALLRLSITVAATLLTNKSGFVLSDTLVSFKSTLKITFVFVYFNLL